MTSGPGVKETMTMGSGLIFVAELIFLDSELG